MSSSVERRMAEQLYNSGQALFEQGLYQEALAELHRSEEAFRGLDARGHAFSSPLANGVSGLANSLALSGLCHRKLGDYKSALACFETSLINTKFEKKKPFRAFKQKLAENMTFCYQKAIADADEESLLESEPEMDSSFLFPYSLPPGLIPFARLYELSPEAYREYGGLYERWRQRDSEVRRRSKTIDDSVMKRLSIYVWMILFMIWSVYGLIAIDAFLHAQK